MMSERTRLSLLNNSNGLSTGRRRRPPKESWLMTALSIGFVLGCMAALIWYLVKT